MKSKSVKLSTALRANSLAAEDVFHQVGVEAADDPNLSPEDFYDSLIARPEAVAKNPGLRLLLVAHPELLDPEPHDAEGAKALEALARQDVPYAVLALLEDSNISNVRAAALANPNFDADKIHERIVSWFEEQGGTENAWVTMMLKTIINNPNMQSRTVTYLLEHWEDLPAHLLSDVLPHPNASPVRLAELLATCSERDYVDRNARIVVHGLERLKRLPREVQEVVPTLSNERDRAAFVRHITIPDLLHVLLDDPSERVRKQVELTLELIDD